MNYILHCRLIICNSYPFNFSSKTDVFSVSSANSVTYFCCSNIFQIKGRPSESAIVFLPTFSTALSVLYPKYF